MSKNCPFCPPDTPNEAWGLSPEGWEQMRVTHYRDHISDVTKMVSVQKELLNLYGKYQIAIARGERPHWESKDNEFTDFMEWLKWQGEV